MQIKTKIVSCHTANSNSQTGGQLYSDTSPLVSLVFPCLTIGAGTGEGLGVAGAREGEGMGGHGGGWRVSLSHSLLSLDHE